MKCDNCGSELSYKWELNNYHYFECPKENCYYGIAIPKKKEVK